MKPSKKILAIDIGYGDTKVKSANKTFKFKSGFAPYRHVDLGLGSTYGVEVWVDKVAIGPVIVGEPAVHYPGFVEPSENSRLGSEEAIPLLAEAVVRADLHGDIILATGAPIDLYQNERINLKKWLNKVISIKTTENTTHDVRIVETITRPQGIAAAIFLASENKFPKEHGIALVIDPGSRTTDIVAISLPSLDPIKSLCFSIPVGVGDLFNGIATSLGKELNGFRPKRGNIQQQFENEFFEFRGRKVELQPIIQVNREIVMVQLENEIRKRIGDQAEDIIAIAGSGGGALDMLLGQILSRVYPGVSVIPCGDGVSDPSFMNVEGYYVIADRLSEAKQQKSEAS